MSLINRLIGQEMTESEDILGKLPVHQCIAAWGQNIAGKAPFVTWSVMIERFGLTPTEDLELQVWNAAVGAGLFSLQELEHTLQLGESGGPMGAYLTVAEIKAQLNI